MSDPDTKQTTERAERVAKALWRADATDADWRDDPTRWDTRHRSVDRERYLHLARAAIKEIDNG